MGLHQERMGSDGRHYTLSQYFVSVHQPKYVQGEFAHGATNVLIRSENERKIRSLRSKFRGCQEPHEGPCVCAIPEKVKTPLGVAKIKAFRGGKMFEVQLPYGKAYLSGEY